MPEPEAHTLAGGRIVVNDLLLYTGVCRVMPPLRHELAEWLPLIKIVDRAVR
jgi:hypothetical protein